MARGEWLKGDPQVGHMRSLGARYPLGPLGLMQSHHSRSPVPSVGAIGALMNRESPRRSFSFFSRHPGALRLNWSCGPLDVTFLVDKMSEEVNSRCPLSQAGTGYQRRKAATSLRLCRAAVSLQSLLGFGLDASVRALEGRNMVCGRKPCCCARFLDPPSETPAPHRIADRFRMEQVHGLHGRGENPAQLSRTPILNAGTQRTHRVIDSG